MRARPYLVLTVLAIAALVQIGVLFWQRTRSELPPLGAVEPLPRGNDVPDVPVLLPSGRKSTLRAALAGQCRLFVVFSTTCPYCISMASSRRFTGPRFGVEVTWVSVPDDLDAVSNFVLQYDIEAPWVMAQSWDAIGALGVSGTPTILGVSPSGSYLGYLSSQAERLPSDWPC